MKIFHRCGRGISSQLNGSTIMKKIANVTVGNSTQGKVASGAVPAVFGQGRRVPHAVPEHVTVEWAMATSTVTLLRRVACCGDGLLAAGVRLLAVVGLVAA